MPPLKPEMVAPFDPVETGGTAATVGRGCPDLADEGWRDGAGAETPACDDGSAEESADAFGDAVDTWAGSCAGEPEALSVPGRLAEQPAMVTQDTAIANCLLARRFCICSARMAKKNNLHFA